MYDKNHYSIVISLQLIKIMGGAGGKVCRCFQVAGHPCPAEELGPFRLKRAFPVALLVKNLPGNAGDRRDTGLIPGSGKIPGRKAW